jgi:hypothetical protein
MYKYAYYATEQAKMHAKYTMTAPLLNRTTHNIHPTSIANFSTLQSIQS